jgi:thioredoxin 1
MKILKLHQPKCPKCDMVENFLNDQGVQFDSVDVSVNTDVAERFRIMGTPVVVLLDENDREVKRSASFNPPELLEIIELASK